MTATTATDTGSPPVQYEFEFVSGGPGGTGSGWQSGTTYTDGGLTPNTQYTYRVHARDSASPPNVTGYSGTATATTFANVPAAPLLGNATIHNLNLDVQPNGNPAVTVFAVQCTATPDATWSGKYVDAGGQPSATEVWQTDAQWGNLLVGGLRAATSYTFAVKARNLNNVQTALGPGATLATTYLAGDANCDGLVNPFDIDPFILALTDPAGYQAQYSTCTLMTCDANQDGLVNAFDIDPFITLLTGP
jgi:hypothetical protein